MAGMVDGPGDGAFRAYWSYVRDDDRAEGGRITALAVSLQAQLEMRQGARFAIFVDGGGIRWGAQWESTIGTALRAATYLIPVLTPRYFDRPWCRREFEMFMDLAASDEGGDKMVLPIYYSTVPQFDTESRSDDPLVERLKAYEHVDWRPVVHHEPDSGSHRFAVAGLVQHLVEREAAIAQANAGPIASTVDDGPCRDAELGVAVHEVLPVLRATTRPLDDLVEELRATLADAPKGSGQSSGRFAARVARAGQVAREIEGPVAEFHHLGTSYLEQVSAFDVIVRRVALRSARGGGTPAREAFVSALDPMVAQADSVADLVRSVPTAGLGNAYWSKELGPVDRALDEGRRRFAEAHAMVHSWAAMFGREGRP